MSALPAAFKHSYDPTLPPPPGIEPPEPPRGKRSKEPSTDIYFSEIIQPKKAPAKDVVTLIMCVTDAPSRPRCRATYALDVWLLWHTGKSCTGYCSWLCSWHK